MRVSILVLLMVSLVSLVGFGFTSVAQENVVREKAPRPLRPVHTFSIVARDPNTGELGVAVQSHWFSVGSIVAWAEAGVGAVATQSFVDPSYGKNGLDMMRAVPFSVIGQDAQPCFSWSPNQDVATAWPM